MSINVENIVNRYELRDDSDEDGFQVCQFFVKKKTKEEEIKEFVFLDNKKQSWEDEYVEVLIGYLKDYKILCYFNGFELILRLLYFD